MTMSSGRAAGLSEISPHYDVLFCDVWGVVHNGASAFPSAIEALIEFRARFGQSPAAVILITNAPRRTAPILAMLDRLGVPRNAFDAVISSGETTRALLAPYRGRVIHHVGPQTADDSLYEGLGVIRGSAALAEAVVVTDLDSDDDTADMYDARIDAWLRRGLPLICANPDKVVEDNGRLVECGGALADRYAAAGGKVHMAGKPFQPIYDEALRLAEAALGSQVPRGRILAIGDSVRTDAVGAAAFGIDLLFITGSVHAADISLDRPLQETARRLVEPTGVHLAGAMARLRW